MHSRIKKNSDCSINRTILCLKEKVIKILLLLLTQTYVKRQSIIKSIQKRRVRGIVVHDCRRGSRKFFQGG